MGIQVWERLTDLPGDTANEWLDLEATAFKPYHIPELLSQGV